MVRVFVGKEKRKREEGEKGKVLFPNRYRF